MRLHRFSIDETASGSKRLVHWRGFATLYRDDEKEVGSAHLEVVAGRPKPEFSARFHVGGRGSETPWDGHLTVLGSGVYWGLGFGRDLAERVSRRWLSRCTKHPYETRDLKLAIHNRRLWWHLWTHPSRYERGEFARWRDGNLRISPLDRLFGERRYWYEPVATADLLIALPDGEYPVVATLRRQLYGRPKLKRREKSWTVHVDAPQGIPMHGDRSEWKGDRVYGFGVKLRARRDAWSRDALNAITARVYQARADSGFRKPQE